MHIESIRLKNFKSFKEMEINNLPKFCVFVGANGSGKSTIFSVFEFLKRAMSSNINAALANLGGSRGFAEVRSRNQSGSIEIEIKFREDSHSPLITYFLEIDQADQRKAYVKREILKYRRGSSGQPWHFLDFANGHGEAVTNELDLDNIQSVEELEREQQTLKSPDILAIKGLAQFERFPATVALGNLIDNWHIFDFHVNQARAEKEAGSAEQLSRDGENLSLVLQYFYENHPQVFEQILNQLSRRIPGIEQVESKTTEYGKVLLKFQDGAFEDPFLARYVSDGTIKMLMYLTLLYDPVPHPLLCVEEPENQLYPKLLWELAEEFRSYANRGSQVFVSTHSPDFLNAVNVDEVFLLIKQKGYTQIKAAKDDEQVVAFIEAGDQMGYLWTSGLLPGMDL